MYRGTYIYIGTHFYIGTSHSHWKLFFTDTHTQVDAEIERGILMREMHKSMDSVPSVFLMCP